MENKSTLFFGMIGIIIIFLFLLSDLSKQPENGQKICISIESLSDGSSQEGKVWNIECLCPLQNKNLTFLYKIVKIFVVTILLANLFHMNKVLFLQGKGRIYACFKACVFYPAHFLCEWLIQQKGDGKKRSLSVNH